MPGPLLWQLPVLITSISLLILLAVVLCFLFKVNMDAEMYKSKNPFLLQKLVRDRSRRGHYRPRVLEKRDQADVGQGGLGVPNPERLI